MRFNTAKSTQPSEMTSRKRSAFRRCLDFLNGGSSESPKRGRLLLESLEKRQMLAGDVDLFATDGTSDNAVAAETTSTLVSTSQPEGELVNDLVGFARALAQEGVQFFGANWCPACTQQKQLFQDGGDDLPFIEVTGPDRTLNSIGTQENITEFPTWEFPDGSREIGVLSLETLSQRSGVSIPQSETPSFESVGNQTVQLGSPLHIPIDVYDPDGGPQTVTITVDNPNLLGATVLSGNRSIRIDMEGYGDMVFELFEQRAPAPSGRVIQLAESGFYDGIIFHRVIDDFVIQAGDPTGTGTSGSNLGDFDDQFHPDLQHNRSGILSYAKSGDDTNDSQFFVTETPTRHLDFNHSIFGQLVEGEDVRDAISEHETNSSGRPSTDIVIDTIDVFNDTENSVIMLEGLSTTGSTNVTITVTDQDGNTFSETIQVDVVNDTANGQPFLNPTTVPTSLPTNVASQIQLSSTDVEGDAVRYFASTASPNVTVAVNETTGLVTVTPASNFSGGTVAIDVGVRPGAGVTGNSSSDADNQRLSVLFEGEQVIAPTSLDLLASSDTGLSDSDNITNANSHVFTVSGVTSGAQVEIVNVGTGTVVGVGTATGTTIDITTTNIAALGDGVFSLAARQVSGGTTSDISSVLQLTQDRTLPASVADSAATQANVGRAFETDLINTEEGSGLRYNLLTGPTGLTIASETGLINWTPTAAQAGANDVSFQVTDAAGNSRTESLSINVEGAPLGEIRLELTDLSGNVINSTQVGQTFLLRFYGVDARNAFDRDGIFASYADVLFNPDLVQPVSGSVIEYESNFTVVQSGTFRTGEIDELGAASNQLSPTEERESLIATVRMEALAAGTVNIRSEPADATGNEFLLYGSNDEIPAESVAYGSVTLAIGQSFTASPDSFTVAEDSGATSLDVLANDQVVSGNATLSIVSVTQPNSGTATLSNGSVAFTPDADFEGTSLFTYRVTDGTVQEDVTVTVTVSGVNDPPTGVDDQLTVDANSVSNILDVLGNDSIAPDSNETLTVTAVSTSTAGATVVVESGGTGVIYTPPADFTGTDSFTYTLSDGSSTSTATVVVTVENADPPPTAVNDSFTVTEDDSEASFDVLANDTSDASNQAFVLDSVGTPSDGGSARISSDGTQFFYTPAANFFGTETVTYTIRDTGGGLATGTVTFAVTGVDDPPPVLDTSVSVARGVGESSVLALSDLPTNVDGTSESLTLGGLGTPTSGGTVRVDSTTGDILYTPPSDTFTGTDTFTYTVDDGTSTSSGTITVTVEDFTPRSISLPVNVGRLSFSTLAVRLVGTNALGETVEMGLDTSGDVPTFADLLPGSYEIHVPAVPFLIGGDQPQVILVESAATDGDATVSPTLGRLRPEFISIRDWLGSSPTQSILTAVSAGAQSILTSASSQTETVSDPVVELDSTGENVTITGQNSDGADVEVTLPTADSRVQTRGEIDGLRLLRVSVESDEVAFQVTSPAASTTTAEGESVAEGEQLNVDLASNSVNTLAASSQPEGELVNSVTRADVFTPATSGLLGSSQSAVLPLADGDVWVGESTLLPEKTENSAANSFDLALEDVAEDLTIISAEGEAIAQQQDSSSAEAVDAVLTTEIE